MHLSREVLFRIFQASELPEQMLMGLTSQDGRQLLTEAWYSTLPASELHLSYMASRSLNLTKWAVSEGCPINAILVSRASGTLTPSKFLELVIFYRSTNSFSPIPSNNLFRDAAAGGNITMLSSLFDIHLFRIDGPELSPFSTHDKNPNLKAKYCSLLSEGTISKTPMSTAVMKAAIQNGSLPTVTWLFSHGFPVPENGMCEAAKIENLPILKYLAKMLVSWNIDQVYTVAASTGNLSLVQYLDEVGMGGDPVLAFYAMFPLKESFERESLYILESLASSEAITAMGPLKKPSKELSRYLLLKLDSAKIITAIAPLYVKSLICIEEELISVIKMHARRDCIVERLIMCHLLQFDMVSAYWMFKLSEKIEYKDHAPYWGFYNLSFPIHKKVVESPNFLKLVPKQQFKVIKWLETHIGNPKLISLAKPITIDCLDTEDRLNWFLERDLGFYGTLRESAQRKKEREVIYFCLGIKYIREASLSLLKLLLASSNVDQMMHSLLVNFARSKKYEASILFDNTDHEEKPQLEIPKSGNYSEKAYSQETTHSMPENLDSPSENPIFSNSRRCHCHTCVTLRNGVLNIVYRGYSHTLTYSLDDLKVILATDFKAEAKLPKGKSKIILFGRKSLNRPLDQYIATDARFLSESHYGDFAEVIYLALSTKNFELLRYLDERDDSMFWDFLSIDNPKIFRFISYLIRTDLDMRNWISAKFIGSYQMGTKWMFQLFGTLFEMYSSLRGEKQITYNMTSGARSSYQRLKECAVEALDFELVIWLYDIVDQILYNVCVECIRVFSDCVDNRVPLNEVAKDFCTKSLELHVISNEVYKNLSGRFFWDYHSLMSILTTKIRTDDHVESPVTFILKCKGMFPFFKVRSLSIDTLFESQIEKLTVAYQDSIVCHFAHGYVISSICALDDIEMFLEFVELFLKHHAIEGEEQYIWIVGFLAMSRFQATKCLAYLKSKKYNPKRELIEHLTSNGTPLTNAKGYTARVLKTAKTNRKYKKDTLESFGVKSDVKTNFRQLYTGMPESDALREEWALHTEASVLRTKKD